MIHLNISVPEDMRDYIEEQVNAGGYTTPSEYLSELIREDQKRKAQQRLEALLLEGLESGPATPMTDADWDDHRRRFDERHQNRSER